MSQLLCLTQGEPAGVGPDLIVRVLQKKWSVPLLVLADERVLKARAKQLNLALNLIPYEGKAEPGKAYLYAVPCSAVVKPGQLDVQNSTQLIQILEQSSRFALDKVVGAIVTAPVHKGIINQAGFSFSGHTEFYADLARVPQVVMMLLNEKMRMTLLTTHIPLKEVANQLTREHLTSVIQIIDQEMRHKFKIQHPRIVVCGLNPHAGEGGYLGREEIDIIEPVMKALREKGLDLKGPIPADTLFLEPADVYLAMYHDQGLPLLKYSDFYHSVNLTLGLPYIRTSVDHGTALALAGTAKVDTSSMESAMKLAIELMEKQ